MSLFYLPITSVVFFHYLFYKMFKKSFSLKKTLCLSVSLSIFFMYLLACITLILPSMISDKYNTGVGDFLPLIWMAMTLYYLVVILLYVGVVLIFYYAKKALSAVKA